MKSALYINGSPHDKGATVSSMKMVEEKMRSLYSSEWVNVYDLNIKPCIGCNKCRPDGVCILPADDGQKIRKKIENADLLVIGSPVYWGNITAPLKLLFDRNVIAFEHFSRGGPTPKLTGKKGIIVVTGGAGPDDYEKINQGGGAIQAIKTILESGGVSIEGVINIHSAWNFENRKNEVKDFIQKEIALN